MTIPFTHMLFLAILLFVMGAACAMTRKNLFMILIGVEVMLNAAGIAFIALIMVIVAWVCYGIRIQPGESGEETFQNKLYALFLNGFYLDRLYQNRIVTPFRSVAGFLWQQVDAGWVDAGLDQGARSFLDLAERLRLWTTGRISQYVSMMVAGFTLILCCLTVAWWVFQI